MMKFFKPELLALARSLDDEVADAASLRWRENLKAYSQRHEAIRDKLRAGNVHTLDERFSLHDADLLELETGILTGSVILVAKLAGGQSILLNYVVGDGGGVCVRRRASVAEDDAPPVILYDEFDWDDETDCLTHSLLLNGAELVVRFTRLSVDVDRVVKFGWRVGLEKPASVS